MSDKEDKVKEKFASLSELFEFIEREAENRFKKIMQKSR